MRKFFYSKNLKKLVVFSFLVVVSTATQAQLNVTLNATNIGCNGYKTGVITATVTGGVPPYHYKWTNDAGDVTSINHVSIGYYGCYVYDSNGNEGKDELTITESEPMRISQFEPHVYGNGYNTSCFFCFDGQINLSVTGGVAPYTYLWSDGSTQQNRTGLAAKSYQVRVTDSYGCVFEEKLNMTLVAPERDDWTQTGNNNVNSNSFIGTINCMPLSFKTNNVERFRLTETGDARLSNGKLLFGSGNNEISFTSASNGQPNFFKIGPGGGLSPEHPCNLPNTNQWLTQFTDMIQISQYPQTGASRLMSIGFDNVNGIIDVAGNNWTGDGSPNLLMNYYCGKDIYMCTGALGGRVNIGTGVNSNNTFNVRGTSFFTGKVGIGINPNSMTTSTFAVDGIIGARGVNLYDISVSIPDYVFEKNYKLKPLLEVEAFVNENKHLEGFPTAAEVCENGLKMDELQIKQMEKIEELYLYVIELKKQNDELKNRLGKLETNK